MLAIERGLEEAHGRNGELPAETRARVLAQRAAAAADAGGAPSGSAAAASAAAAAADEERRRQISARLDEIKRQLAREDETWTT